MRNPFRRRKPPSHMTPEEARAYRQGRDDLLRDIIRAVGEVANKMPGEHIHMTPAGDKH